MTERPAQVTDRRIGVDEAIDRLRDAGGRITDTRRTLLDHLHGLDGRITADELAAAHPDVDPATIYRSLGQFESAGIVEHVHIGHGPSSYRWVGHRTVSIVCAECGAAVDVPLETFRAVDDRIADEYGFRLALGHFALTATCAGCRERA